MSPHIYKSGVKSHFRKKTFLINFLQSKNFIIFLEVVNTIFLSTKKGAAKPLSILR